MFAKRKFAACAAAAAFVGLGSFGHSAYGEPIQRRGPVGPNDTIIATVGNKGLIAFYELSGLHCSIYAVVYTLGDESGASATQVRMQLNARQIINIDGSGEKSLALQCGEQAETLSIVDVDTLVAGASER